MEWRFFFFSLCELNIWNGSGCFVVGAFKFEVFLYLVIILVIWLVKSISYTYKGKEMYNSR